jgi:hypothetical protein
MISKTGNIFGIKIDIVRTTTHILTKWSPAEIGVYIGKGTVIEKSGIVGCAIQSVIK